LKILFSFFAKQAALMRGSTVLSLILRLVFPGQWYKTFFLVAIALAK
jgi:hypothetical protein